MRLSRCLGKGLRGGWARWILDASEADATNERPEGGIGCFRETKVGTGGLVFS